MYQYYDKQYYENQTEDYTANDKYPSRNLIQSSSPK